MVSLRRGALADLPVAPSEPRPVPLGEGPTDQVAWLDAARVISAIAVVLLHVSGVLVSRADLGSPAWWMANLYDSFVRWSIPVFVMISGALLLDARRSRQQPMWDFYRRRGDRILVPLVFWSMVFIGWSEFRSRDGGEPYDVRDAIESVVNGKPYFHLWFLYMLIGLYLFTPLLRVAVRNAPRRELWFFVGIMFAMSAWDQWTGASYNTDDTPFMLWFLPFVGYFICGHLIASSEWKIGRVAALAGFVVAGTLTAVGCHLLSQAQGFDDGQYFYGYLSVTTIPAALSAMFVVRSLSFSDASAKRLRLLAGPTLGVYLVHPIFLDLARGPIARTGDIAALALPAIAAAIFAASLMVASLVRLVPVLRSVV